MSKIHFDKIEKIVGFSAENVKGPGLVKVLTKASLISDQPEFYIFMDKISGLIFTRTPLLINSVFQFLFILHPDLTADLYVNDFPVFIEIRGKRRIEKAEAISHNDIAEIRRLRFHNIPIEKTDKLIYCFKVGWKFALYFNLNPQSDLDIAKMELELGGLYRYLEFQHVYKVLESSKQFEEMINDGWFPFIEIIGSEYKRLCEFYQNKFDFENKIKNFVDSFDKARIEKITGKWWANKIFNKKQPLIKAGIEAYRQNNESGFINCVKTLSTELEGIIRLHYFDETKVGKVNLRDLIQHVIEKGKLKAAGNYSLFLVVPFLEYLEKVIFRDFDLEKGEINLSRHTASHGVAAPEDYVKERALQTILTLDQIYFYLS